MKRFANKFIKSRIAGIIYFSIFVFISDYSSHATNCEIYREGELISGELQVFSDWNKYKTVTIKYRPEYHVSPVSLCALDERCTGALFKFDIQSGKPIPSDDLDYMRNVYGYTHASLLINSHAWFPVVRRLPTYALRPAGASFEGYEFTGETLGGHRLIFYPDDEDVLSAANARKKEEVGIRLDNKGDVVSVLSCNRIGAYPNPNCSYFSQFEEFGPILLTIAINRKQLPNLQKAIQHAEAFTSCLTQPVE